MATRYYANAAATALSGSCTALDTTITVDSVTGLPIQYPFVMILDRGTGAEEVVLVTNASGTDLTVSRGYDDTTAFAHSAGAEAVHGVSAIDHREANTHVNSTTGVHGLTGAVVGTTDTQTVTNKDLSSSSNTFPSSLATEVEVTSAISDHDAEAATLTNKTISADSNTISGLAASSFAQTNASGNLDGSAAAKAIPTGAVVGTTDTQTLTNKDLTDSTNSFPAMGIQEIVTFSTSGSFTKADYPWLRKVRARVVGGGGGGGDCPATSSTESAAGGGGGGGGYSESLLDVASLAAVETVTVGGGGSGASGDGNPGTASSFAGLTGNGGSGGNAGVDGTGDGAVEGGAGGTGAGGDINVQGGYGAPGVRSETPGATLGGAGGSTPLGMGAPFKRAEGTGASGTGYGSGGAGGKANTLSTGEAGGDGAGGVVILELYA